MSEQSRAGRPLHDVQVEDDASCAPGDDASLETCPEPCDPRDRREGTRHGVQWAVDCETEETFLYAVITNISEMGIFVQTQEPLAVGTAITLRFAPHGGAEPFALGGVVQWINRVSQVPPPCLNPGMGVRFANLTLDDRERIVEAIHTIAYLREEPKPSLVN